MNKMSCCQIDFNKWEWNVSTLNENKWRRFQWNGNQNLANTTIPAREARCDDNNRLDGGNKANRNHNPMQMMTHCVHIHVNVTESQGNTLDGHTANCIFCVYVLFYWFANNTYYSRDNRFENLSFANKKCISARWRTQSLINSENQYQRRWFNASNMDGIWTLYFLVSLIFSFAPFKLHKFTFRNPFGGDGGHTVMTKTHKRATKAKMSSEIERKDKEREREKIQARQKWLKIKTNKNIGIS